MKKLNSSLINDDKGKGLNIDKEFLERMSLENILGEDKIWQDYMSIFHSNHTKKYIRWMETIRTHSREKIRKNANDKLLNLFNLSHISLLNAYVIRENNKETIKWYKERKRKSGRRPYVVHPVSVEYLLSSLGVDEKVLISATRHDNVEFKIKDKKEKNPHISDEDIDKFTNKMIIKEYHEIKKIAKAAYRRYARDKNIPKAELGVFDIKKILYSCIITQKVTRYESDKNYLASIDKIVDEDITIDNPAFRGLFLEYLKDIKKNKSLEETDLEIFRRELTLSKEEIHNIISDAWLVKIADRISNTKDTYKKQPFSDKITDIYKNFLVVDSLRNYMKNSIEPNNYISEEKYRKLNYLSKMLLKVSMQRLYEEKIKFLERNKKNEKFCYWQKDINEELKKSKGLFSHIDSEPTDKQMSGLVVTLYNKTLNKDENTKRILDKSSSLEAIKTQYKAIEGLIGVFSQYLKKPDFVMENMDVLRNI